MKRYFYIVFACVCAMLCVRTVQAQDLQSGDIITISDGSGRYLAVNDAGTGVVDKTTMDKYCYWEVTIAGSTYSFRSITADEYLYIGNSRLSLEESGSFTMNDNVFYRQRNNGGNYYIRYNGGWTSTMNSSDATKLTLTEVVFTEISTSGFVHSKGVTGDALNDKGYQQVHTAERTIYYAEGDEIALILPETSFRGYFRWYDYNTDGSPIAGGASWEATPSAGGAASEFTYNSKSYGWYIHSENGLTGDANTPVINATWTEQTARTLACDVSAYTDFASAGEPVYDFDNMTITSGGFTEPTLSYRQIYHLKPAAEMAKELEEKSKKGEYLEVYNYLAPTNKEILLTTEFRYIGSKATYLSELCYFYNEASPIRVNGTTNSMWWYKDDALMNTLSYTTAKDYLRVSSTSTTSAKYELRVPNSVTGLGYDLLIAQFNVTFVSDCGPTANATPLKTKADIDANFDVLEYNDFSYGFEPSTTADTHLDFHLPWEQSSFGNVYTANKIAANKVIRQGGDEWFPYWGEYTLVNRVTDHNWANGANHVDNTEDQAASRQGYALFVDGTQEPGLVASISTKEKVRICEKQNIYCSIWLRNTGANVSDGSNPIFRCNVQGRNTGDTEWSDVGVFFVGELSGEETWRQVVFPVMATESYDETRVSIYNFANSHSGNDFMIDDITLYTDHLPMSSYQIEPSMVGNDNTLPFTMAVLRVEYDERERSQSLYYQIYDLDDNGSKTPVQLTDYITPSTSSVPHGCVTIPVYNYNPDTDATVDSNHKFADLQSFYANVYSNNPTTGICYVNDGGTWVMYIVHAIPKTPATSGPYPYEKNNYGVRMSYGKAEDLGNVDDCSMDMPFAVTQETTFELRNALDTDETKKKEFLVESSDNCANTLYELDIKITQDMEPQVSGGEEEGIPYADWLKGIASDDVFANTALANDAEADAKFLEHYGYSRKDVTAAINDLRSNNNTIADPTALTVEHFTTDANLTIIQTLCANGYLELYSQTVNFYLGSADTARYWVFPIEGTAVSDEGNTLHDTPEPMYVQVSSYDSDFEMKIFNHELPESHSTALPIVRTLASKVNEEIVIHYEEKTWDAASSQAGDAYLYSTTDETLSEQLGRGVGGQLLQYNCVVDNDLHTITLTVPETTDVEFQIGKEYIVGVTLRDAAGNSTPGTGNNGCPVGTWFFDILLVPDVVEWIGDDDDIWGDDANWQGYADGEEVHHYVPIEGSGVVIPAGKAPKLTVLTVNPQPLHVNYPMSPVCGQVYFASGAMMENQHLLVHEKAFVDMEVPHMTWNSVAMPITGAVAGDMFIPHTNTGTYQGENTESIEPFGVKSFEGSRLSTSAFAFWQSFYNRTVELINENPSKNESAIATSTVAFAPTNSLEEALPVGSGHQLLGFGPDDYTSETLTIRLPKPDTEYSYYHPNGAAGAPVSVDRGENPGKLAFAPIDGGMSITLTNEQASTDEKGNLFMFGNPAMANIDMAQFIADNADVLEGSYYQMTNDSWQASTTWASANGGYLAPMRSIMLKAKGTGNTLTVVLKPEHLSVGTTTAVNGIAPRSKVAAKGATPMMVVRADVQGTVAQCIVAANNGANDTYTQSEDALFFSSGVEAEVSDVAATSPVNMYTLSERVPMMVDVRKNIDTIPLAMLVMDSYQTDKMTLTFNLSADWDKDTYFCDSETGEKTLIKDGMELQVALSKNHEARYFIEGPGQMAPDDGVVSSTENLNGEIDVWTYSPNSGSLVVATNDILKSVAVYDLSGRMVAGKELALQYNTTSLSIPTGAYIVKAVLRDNSVHTLSALVK